MLARASARPWRIIILSHADERILLIWYVCSEVIAQTVYSDSMQCIDRSGLFIAIGKKIEQVHQFPGWAILPSAHELLCSIA